ncbi:hypothetical protein QNM99_13940 [Pseudomonas sp. PCH446]
MPACGGARCVFNQDTTAKLIHNCWDKNQQSALGQFSIGRVGQFSISANSAGDIAGKMLALPVSLAALVALHNTKSRFEAFILIVGLGIVAVVLLAILHNQRLQVERLLHSFNVIFDDFKGKIKTYPGKLQMLLKITIDQVERQG